MVTFDSFVAFDSEKDLMRFRCHYGERLVLCAVTRAALVAGSEHKVSTRNELMKLYEARSQEIQRAVMYRLQGRSHSDDSVIIVDVADVFKLGRSSQTSRQAAG